VESEASIAPPVVAVVVVHDPGVWFDETVASMAAQDYPNLRLVFLITGAEDEVVVARVSDTISRHAGDAFVTLFEGNPGYGPAANEVQRLVEGDSGFFLLCHDDVALDRDAVTRLVEELYRSNAGIVGPKLVEWDRPASLQHVGLSLDRFGEIDPIVEADEVDQEQHDAVQDVFVVPSACLLVRADLFRTIGGFDAAVDYHGDDVDLCWRAHFSGARVLVVPAARVRHRERLEERRPDLNHRVLRAHHRMRSVATLTGLSRLPLRSVEMVALTLAEMVVGVFTGRFPEAWASMRALVGLIPRTPWLLARRRAVAKLRTIPEPELLDLQVRGSSRLSSYLRTRDTMTYVGADSTVRRWRATSTAPTLAWLAVIAAVVIGSRTFISRGVPAIGEFLPFPESPGALMDQFRSGWNPDGLGATSPNPTGWAAISLLSVGTLFHMGLAHTVAVIGLVLAGILGAARVGTVFPSTRARLASFVVYGAVPLVSGMLAQGRWTGLVAYAAVPWFVHLLRRAAGIGTADPRLVVLDLVDGLARLTWRDRVRYFAYLGLVAALAAAFAPVVALLLGAVGVVLAVATLLAGGSWRTSLWLSAGTLVAMILAVGLNLPWSTTWTWDTLTLARTAGPEGRGLVDIATFGLSDQPLAVLAIALYVSLLGALVLGRAWRLTWAVRAAMLVVAFGSLAVLADRGTLSMRLPDVSVLLVPVALGLALGAAAVMAAFDLDVRGGGFGWRQPAGVLANVAVVVGVIPGLVAVGDGAWSTPDRSTPSLLGSQLPDETTDGDYRVLFLGDPRLLPVPAQELTEGVGYAVVDDDPLDVRDRWVAPDTDADNRLRLVLDLLANGDTLRAGQLMAPLGIRYIVVPRTDDSESTSEDPLPVPGGLLESLEDQLDLALTFSPPSAEVFENRSAMPTGAQLTGETAEASGAENINGLVGADLTQAEPVFVGADATEITSDDLTTGVMHLATSFDERWELRGGSGPTLDPRNGFGVTNAWDVAGDAVGERPATLRYATDTSRSVLLLVVAGLWLATLLATSRARNPLRRRRHVSEDATLIALGSDGDNVALDELLAHETHGGWIDDVLDERGDETVDQRDGRTF